MGEPSQSPTAEIELKLAGAPKALARLIAAPPIAERAQGRPVSHRLESVYFDTPDLRLHKKALALRVRRVGRKYVQTLKSDGRGGAMLSRGEWEVPVRSMKPDLAALGRPAALRTVGPLRADDLQSLFASRVQREVRIVRDTDPTGTANEIEVAFDLGVVEADSGKVPVCEIELQLLRGAPESLYRLALELHEIAPVRVETQSKSARGYGLARGAAPAWRKAGRLELRPETTVDEALAAIVRACADHWSANEAAAFDGTDPEGIHQMRVALRRLRSALTAFRKVIPADQLAWLRGESKWLLDRLAPARDWDVFLSDLLVPLAVEHSRSKALAAAVDAARGARASSYAVARRAVRSARYTRLLLRLGMWVEGHGWRSGAGTSTLRLLDEPMVTLADRLLTKRHKRVIRLGEDFPELSDDERHRLRIALKKLRYPVEFFRSLYPKSRAAPYARALGILQDDLGHLNDAAVADSLLGELAARNNASRTWLGGGARLVRGWQAAAVAVTKARLNDRWQEFVGDTPFWHLARR